MVEPVLSINIPLSRYVGSRLTVGVIVLVSHMKTVLNYVIITVKAGLSHVGIGRIVLVYTEPLFDRVHHVERVADGIVPLLSATGVVTDI